MVRPIGAPSMHVSRFRRVPPVYSPLGLQSVSAAFGTDDPRRALADDLARDYGATEAVLLSSGTAALTLALCAAAEARPGLPCALPAYGCFDLATAAIGAGMRVRLYDLEPRTLAPDPQSLARALDGGAAALVVVHLYGVPVPMDQMRRAADSAGAMLIEDAAQGNGGAWDGVPLGSHGDVGILSFGRGKGETAGGGGALLLHGSADLSPALRAGIGAPATGALIAGVKLAAQWLLGRPALYAIPATLPMLRLGETVYRPPEPIRWMSPSASRVLLHSRRASAHESAVRRSSADALLRLVGQHGASVLPATARARAGWLRLPLLLDLGPEHLEAGGALGVQRGYPMALGALDPLRPFIDDPRETPGADRLARVLHTLPTHSLLHHDDRRALADWLVRALGDS